MIFLPLAQGSSSSASGTRVVLPAPGGATSTAALLPASVRARSSSTASIGRGVSKERKGLSEVAFLTPSPRPCGERVGVRGTLHTVALAENPPHPGFFLAPNRPLPPNGGGGESIKSAVWGGGQQSIRGTPAPSCPRCARCFANSPS